MVMGSIRSDAGDSSGNDEDEDGDEDMKVVMLVVVFLMDGHGNVDGCVAALQRGR